MRRYHYGITHIRQSTPAQRWAQERNWLKFRLMGLSGILHTLKREKTLTKQELDCIEALCNEMDFLMKIWPLNNERSKNNYLKEGERNV